MGPDAGQQIVAEPMPIADDVAAAGAVVVEHDAPRDHMTTQVMTAVDGYGAPVLLAALFVYVVVGSVKHPIHDWLSGRGVEERKRKNLVNLVNFPVGMLAALFVDFQPIAEAVFKTDLHWAQAIPVGGVVYAFGAKGLYRIAKDYDPIEFVLGKFGMKSKADRQREYERQRRATQQHELTPSTIHDLKAIRDERAARQRDEDSDG